MSTIPDLTDRDAWTDDGLTGLLEAVRAEQQRRWTLDHAEAQADQLAQDYQAAVGRQDGDPWVQPTGAHDAYQTGDLVTWQGQVYRSNRDGNVWSPSDLPSGWDLVPDTPAQAARAGGGPRGA